MKKSSKGFIHLIPLSVLALLLVLGVGYYAYKSGKIRSTISQQDTLTSSEDLIANWETYINKELNYSFKYPPDWIVRESISQGYPYITMVPPGNTTKGAGGGIMVDKRNPWFANKAINESIPLTYGGSADSYEYYTLNGIKGMLYTRFDEAGTEAVQSDQLIKGFGFFKKIDGEELIFDIGIGLFDYNNIPEEKRLYYLSTFDQILSTFQFIE